MITSLRGTRASLLGLAAGSQHAAGCVRRAFQGGINFFFFYGAGYAQFVTELATLVRKRRDEVIVATGSGARQRGSLLTARRKIARSLGTELIDVFFAEYVNCADDPKRVFGDGGVLDELQRWKAEGSIRYVGATTHDRRLAAQLARDQRVDVLMHRFNMVHRKAAGEVFPVAIRAKTPVVAFTATRWGTLLQSHAQWSGEPPTATDCYRFCVAHPAVHVVLSAPRSVKELKENLRVLQLRSMSRRDCTRWERFGDLLHAKGTDPFETRWP